MSGRTWCSSTTVHAAPEHVIDVLTDPDACARWSPIPFSVDKGRAGRLRAGTVTPVSGRLLGARLRFCLHTLTADRDRLRLHARGPIDIHVDYRLTGSRAGCHLDARVSVPASHAPFGRLLARATEMLLARGTLEQTVDRIAHEAEMAADAAEDP
jgi:polyketide cyclase/dehydrase/lipid transport protein